MPQHPTSKEAVRNFHVPLPEQLYQHLKAEAAHSQRSANALAREAIAVWLATQERIRLDREVLDYATALAGTADDLDPELEAAGLELLGRIE
ncbi:MAG TPA: hypothetical protein VNL71_25305 [Chloroflexota bacterium]|nr:hypothetical protein [Chloroflexota bacterium]